MAPVLSKWLFIAAIPVFLFAKKHHPIYVSVVQIEHNAKQKILEISCKIFTDDFEKTLRKTYNTYVDLLAATGKPQMDKLVNDYVQKHFKMSVDGRPVTLKYLGYEQDEEGIACYFEGDNITWLKTINVFDNILYEYQPQQMSLIHCTVNGNTQNYKLNNPETTAAFSF